MVSWIARNQYRHPTCQNQKKPQSSHYS